MLDIKSRVGVGISLSGTLQHFPLNLYIEYLMNSKEGKTQSTCCKGIPSQNFGCQLLTKAEKRKWKMGEIFVCLALYEHWAWHQIRGVLFGILKFCLLPKTLSSGDGGILVSSLDEFLCKFPIHLVLLHAEREGQKSFAVRPTRCRALLSLTFT